MTPFEEFRLWAREGSPVERAFAAVAAAVALALVLWVAVPATKSGNGTSLAVGSPGGQSAASGSVSGGSGTGSAVAGGASGTSVGAQVSGSGGANQSGGGSAGTGVTASGGPGQQAATASSVPVTTAPGAPSPNPSGPKSPTGVSCGTPGSTDQGVTASTITVGVLLLDVAGGNAVIGVPQPGEQQAENDAVVKAINAAGGIDCRKVVTKYYSDNPLDANSEHSTCLQVIADKPFAVIGGFYEPQDATCLPQAQIPSYTQTVRPTSQMQQFYPYLFAFYEDSTTDFETYVTGSKQAGFFNGMANKLGVITADCFPEYNTQLMSSLAAGGIPSGRIETFDYGCATGGVEPPPTVAQAVLQFQQDGVNRVMSAGANLASFSSQAQRQAYHPQYSVSEVDTTLTLTPSAGFAPDAQNFDGALDIANNQYGALNTPGVPLSPATVTCDNDLKAGGASQMAEGGDGYSGGVCNQWNMFVLGATHAPQLLRADLAAGLDSVGQVDQSFPGAPALWNVKGKTWAGPFWRPVRFNGGCGCWKVVNPNFSTDTTP